MTPSSVLKLDVHCEDLRNNSGVVCLVVGGEQSWAGAWIEEAQMHVRKLGPCVLCQIASADCSLVQCLHQDLPSTSTRPGADLNENIVENW